MGDLNLDRVQAEAERLLSAGVAGNVFPGASLHLSFRIKDELHEVSAVGGRTTLRGQPVKSETIYDLASVTKPIFAMAVLRMVERFQLDLLATVDSIFADTKGTVGGKATLEQLLTHRSGLAAWGGLYLDVPHPVGSSAARRWFVYEACRRADVSTKPRALYSDLGYIIAGEMVARVLAMPLAELIRREIATPLGLENQLFFAAQMNADERSRMSGLIAPTERDEWRGRLIHGEVHDENCAALGGAAGHAGLFGSARAVHAFARSTLDSLQGRHAFLRSDTLRMALAFRDGGTPRLGWDGKSEPEVSSAGRRMNADSFGHLGFTGTSIWNDPGRDLSVVLLSNRVNPSRSNEKIKAFRPAFHDAMVASVDRVRRASGAFETSSGGTLSPKASDPKSNDK